jgi:Uma2 family endonuclease
MQTATAAIQIHAAERAGVPTPEPEPAAAPAPVVPLPEDEGVRIRPITVDEYYRMDDAGIFDPDERVELLDGQLIAVPPEGPPHSSASMRLNEGLVRCFAGRAMVRAGNAMRLGPISAPQPDFAVVRSRDDWYGTALPTPSDVLILIEVSHATLRFDRGRKLRAYAAAGIPEVWIVDLVHRRVEVYADPHDGAYAPARVVASGDSITPRAFPDDAIPVASFLP